MKKQISLLAIVLLIAVACKKKTVEPQNTKEFCIQSSTSSCSYTIKISLPNNYDPQNKKYATIYVLDGEDNFALVADRSKKLSQKYGKEDVLVVCIGHGRDRALDYTPTKAKQGGGGAPEFMNFIEKDLIPRIQTEVAADISRMSRVILGHSFGGLFAGYAFTQHNHVFGNYLMLSPSLWYDDEVILTYEAEKRESLMNNNQLVFMGIGELENSVRMQAPFQAFYQILTNYYPETRLLKNSVSKLDHVGSKNPNIEKALEFYFQNK